MRYLFTLLLLSFLALPGFAAADTDTQVISPVKNSVEDIRRMADAGNARAQNALAVLYSDGGRGVEKDEAAAFALYTKSAQQGYAPAQLNLGTFYLKGRGVPQSDVEACFWYSLAFRGGDKLAPLLVERAAKKLTREQTAALEKRVAEWQPTPAETP